LILKFLPEPSYLWVDKKESSLFSEGS
jgi:hypothetical protein